MALSDCPKCWMTPCECGYDYQDRSIEYIENQISMLESVLANKRAKLINENFENKRIKQIKCNNT